MVMKFEEKSRKRILQEYRTIKFLNYATLPQTNPYRGLYQHCVTETECAKLTVNMKTVSVIFSHLFDVGKRLEETSCI